MNIGVNVSFRISWLFWEYLLVYFGYIPRSAIFGLYCSSSFPFLRKFHTVLPSSCTNLHSHQQYMKFPFIPHLHQQLLFVLFLMVASLMSVRWYLIVVLICKSLMISVVEHLFKCLLATCISALEKCLFRSSFGYFFLY